MTKNEAIRAIAALYRVMNRADGEQPAREDWTVPEMAGEAGCQHLDKLLRAWLDAGVLTSDEHQMIYDEL